MTELSTRSCANPDEPYQNIVVNIKHVIGVMESLERDFSFDWTEEKSYLTNALAWLEPLGAFADVQNPEPPDERPVGYRP
jgi:hypothetical protein